MPRSGFSCLEVFVEVARSRLHDREDRQHDHAHKQRKQNHEVDRRRNLGEECSRSDCWRRELNGDGRFFVDRFVQAVQVTFRAAVLLDLFR